MMPPKNSQLRDFKDHLKDVRGLIVTASGGFVLAPLLVALSSYLPPWPEPSVVVTLTTLTEFVLLLLSFQIFRGLSRYRNNGAMIGSAGFLIIFAATYLTMNAFFVYSLPHGGGTAAMGCGLTADAIQILQSQGVPIQSSCPGSFPQLLEGAHYDATRVWQRASVAFVEVVLLITWLSSFGSLAVLIGVFLLVQKPTHKKKAVGKL